MTRSPDSLIPSEAEQLVTEKRDDKAFDCRQEGKANLRAATEVNAVSASSTPPAITPIQLELFPGRACPLKAKPATIRSTARSSPNRRDGVEGVSTQRQTIQFTGETLFGPSEEETPDGREAHKGRTRQRRNEAGQGVGGGHSHSTDELRENRREGRAATFIKRTEQGKAAGLPPQGKAQPRAGHADVDAVILQQIGVVVAGVLRTAIGVVDQPRAHGPAGQRHPQSGQRQFVFHSTVQRPADHSAGIGIRHHRQVDEFFPQPDVCDIGHPELVDSRQHQVWD